MLFIGLTYLGTPREYSKWALEFMTLAGILYIVIALGKSIWKRSRLYHMFKLSQVHSKIFTVIDSCKSLDQLSNAAHWGYGVLEKTENGKDEVLGLGQLVKRKHAQLTSLRVVG